MKKGFFLSLCLLWVSTAFTAELESVNFIHGKDTSRIVIKIKGDYKAKRFHLIDDKQIVLDVKNLNSDRKKLRGFDTSEFSGSMVYFSGYPKPGSPDDIRFTIQLRDNVRSILETNKNSIVLNVENRFGVFSLGKIRKAQDTEDDKALGTLDKKILVPKSEDILDILENLTLSGIKKYVGKRISLNVKNIQIVDLLNIIAETSGFNIIIDKEVYSRSPVTLSLTNIPWDEALDTILNISNLTAKKHANILTVSTFEKMATEQDEKAKRDSQNAKQEFLLTKIFPISFAKLGDLEKIIKDYSTKDRGSIQKDDRTNSLIVKDTAKTIDRIKKIIEVLDTQTPQILIETKIVEANESYAKRIGLENGVEFGVDNITDGFEGLTNIGPGWSYQSATSAANPTAMGLVIGNAGTWANVAINLQLMETESKGKIISSPKIITQNKSKASITSSEATSYQEVTNSAGVLTTTFKSISADLKLDVTPQVTNEGSIAMDVDISKTGFTTQPSPSAPPNSVSRAVKTNVLVDNGATIVIGGLYQTQTLETKSGIPFLKDLPILGWLFRSPYAPSESRTELIIFLSPRIINQEEAGLVDRKDKLGT
jgi:type IV pilus assembly protein PilQ